MQSPWQLLLLWRCWAASLQVLPRTRSRWWPWAATISTPLCAPGPLGTHTKQSLCARHPPHCGHLVFSEMWNCSMRRHPAGLLQDPSPMAGTSTITKHPRYLLWCFRCSQVPADLVLQQCRYLLWMEVVLQGGSLFYCRNFSLCLRYTLAMSQVCVSQLQLLCLQQQDDAPSPKHPLCSPCKLNFLLHFKAQGKDALAKDGLFIPFLDLKNNN